MVDIMVSMTSSMNHKNELIIVPIHKKNVETKCSNCWCTCRQNYSEYLV